MFLLQFDLICCRVTLLKANLGMRRNLMEKKKFQRKLRLCEEKRFELTRGYFLENAVSHEIQESVSVESWPMHRHGVLKKLTRVNHFENQGVQKKVWLVREVL
jgi:hypothetical protein